MGFDTIEINLVVFYILCGTELIYGIIYVVYYRGIL